MNKTLAALRKTSLADYPGKISAVLFFPGCNLSCPWCHNPGLARGQIEDGVPLDEILAFLEKRKKVLEAVVLSGGEAALYTGLPGLITSIKKIPLLVKLDTNGTRPEMLEHLFENPLTRPDYVALDVKLPPARYGELERNHSGNAENDIGDSLKKSAALISQYNIEHEFRTLILPNDYLADADIDAMAQLVDNAPWIFRSFVPGNCLDETWNRFSKTSPDEHHPLIQKAKALGKNIVFYEAK